MLISISAYGSKIIILQDDFPYSSQKFASELEKSVREAYDAQVVNGISLKSVLADEANKGSILLLPNGRCFPADAKSALTSFLKRGNHMLALSGPVFENFVIQANDKWLTAEMIRSEMIKTDGRSFIDFSNEDISKWMRISGAMENYTEFKVEPSGDSSISDALHVNISKLDNWDIIASPEYKQPFSLGEGVLLFWAKGDKETTQLKVQWAETDGTRWIAPIELTEKWQRYALMPSDFKFWKDGAAPGRGGSDDKFNTSKAAKLSFIVERNHSNPDPGKPRSFHVADVRMASDPTSSIDSSEISLETISPEYRMFRTTPATVKVSETSQVFSVNEEIISPISRAPGYGADYLRKWRFIPIGKAYSADSKYRGTAAYLMLNSLGQYAGSIWGGIGFSQDYLEKNSSESIKLVMHLLNRISNGIFMANAGSEHFGYEDTQDVKFGASVINLKNEPVKASLDVKIFLNSKLVDSYDIDAELAAYNLDSPAALLTSGKKYESGEYRVDTVINVNGSAVDRISHTFNVIKYVPLKKRDTVQIKDGDFIFNNKKWYPLGINYWPRSSAALESEDMYGRHWLAPEQYDPDIIEEDLTLMNELKINTVSIQYTNIFQAAPLMDFMARAQKHGIMVHLYIEGLHPLKYSMWGGPSDKSFMETGGGLIAAAHLHQSPAFFAYDVGWEVIVGKYDKRKVFDKEWNKWIINRYGSIESACKDWKYQPELIDGLIAGPSDDQIVSDGEWLAYVSAYRRFWDDEISEGYRRVRDNIRSIDKYHLMGARSGYGGTGTMYIASSFPFDLASGAKHVDFTAPEAYALTGDYSGFLKGGLNNAYGRYFSGDKPVFWPEFGLPVVIGIQPAEYKHRKTPERLDAQLDFYKNMMKLTMETAANGLTGWWWPGGFRLYENSDFGIIDPDGTPRPAALELQKMADKFYTPKTIRKPDFFFTVDRDNYAAGYAGIYTEFADKYVKAFESGKMPGIKTAGTGTTSINTPLIAVGNTPYNGKNPPKYLNAEFNWMMINGKKVADGDTLVLPKGEALYFRGSVGNIADAEWVASKTNASGCVYLAVNIDESESLIPIEKNTPFLGDASVVGSFTPKINGDSVDITLNMVSKGRMKFGDVMHLTIKSK